MRIFFISLFFISLSFCQEICIENFDKKLCNNFKISNGLILKTKLKKNDLKDRLKIEAIREIAFFKNSYIYLIDTANPIKDYNRFKNLDFIEYIIPDIIQNKRRSSFNIQKYQKSLNLNTYWSKTKGEGVNIAIIDDGFNLEHEDLKGANLLFSYDTDNKNLNSTPKVKLDTHGTQVAGIIFAQHNGIGVDGIAPKANLIAIRQTTNITSDTIISFTVAKKAGAHIINCSWNSPLLLEPVYDVIKALSKDTAIVFAAGNSAKKIEPYSIEPSIPEVVTVGATQKYSNYGEVVDFKIASGIMTTKQNGTYGKFGGTSATAPIISGLLALKIAQNKNKPIQEIIQTMKKEINGN